MGGERAVKEQSFYMFKVKWEKIKLVCYNFKILNVNPMVTTKIAIKYIQKEMRKKCEHFSTKKKKNQLNTKEDSNAENEGQKKLQGIQKINSTMTKISCSLLVITYNVTELNSLIK